MTNHDMNASEVLTSAKALIADPQNWCKGYHAVDSDNNRVSANSENACAWCSMGAIQKSMRIDSTINYLRVESAVFSTIEGVIMEYSGEYDTIMSFNDACETQHADVMQVFDAAIERLENRKPFIERLIEEFDCS